MTRVCEVRARNFMTTRMYELSVGPLCLMKCIRVYEVRVDPLCGVKCMDSSECMK